LLAHVQTRAAKAQLADLQASNGARRAMLEQLRSQAGVVRAEVLGNRLPTILRYQALTASHVAAMLEREQRLRLRQLTEVLPLRINAVRSSGGPCQITVANLRLPQSGSTPVGGWPEPEVRARVCCVAAARVCWVRCRRTDARACGVSPHDTPHTQQHAPRLPRSHSACLPATHSRCTACRRHPAQRHAPQSTSAALGYLLLLVDHVGVIMGGPMLHESHHQGSTSSIWQPPSFWSRQPRSAAAMLPLDVLSAVGSAATPAGQAAYSSTANRYLTSATFWGLPTRSDSGGLGPASLANAASAATTFAASAAAAAFTRATGFEAPGFYTPGTSPSAGAGAAATAAAGGAGSSGTGGSSGNVPEASAARRRGSSSGGGDRGGSSGGSGSSGSGRQSDFKAAWDLLQRSLACFLKDKAASNGMQLPSAWNPLAWLVVYCAVVKRDMRQDGKLVALSSRVDAAAAAAAAATAAAGQGSLEGGAAAEVGGGGGSRGGAAAATAQQDDGRLPPPPPAAEGGGGGGGLAPDAAGTGTGAFGGGG
jgi:hypothetical protein